MMRALAVALILLPAAASAAITDELPCVVCHPSRDREAFRVLTDRPEALVGNESAQAFVCLSCHNGAVRDDRELLTQGGQHPQGMRVQRKVPEPFRLYGDRRMECGTCHSPHGESPEAKRWLRVPPNGTTACAGCHSADRGRHLGLPLDEARRDAVSALGGQVDAGARIVCTTCHRVHGAGGSQLLVAAYGPKRDALCRVCHPGTEVKGSRADGNALSCAECHQPHQEKPLLLAGGEAGPCLRCHDARAGPSEHRTGSPTCSDCHSVHHPVRPGGDAAGLLRLPQDNGMLCTGCHPQTGDRHGPDAALVGVDLELLTARGVRRGRASDLECGTCHRPHEAADRPLLNVSRTLLCLYCHEGQNPFGPAGIKPGVHPVGIFLRSVQQGAVAGLFGGEEEKAQVLTCTSCHRAHGEVVAGEPGCNACHPERAGGTGHGGSEGCSACHQIHGQSPPARICQDCHADLAEPLHTQASQASLGDFPAFDGAGRRVPWGGFGCPTCHDPHSEKVHQLRAGSAPATCLGCHSEKEVIRAGPHDGRKFAEGSGDEGLCRICHPAHGKAPGQEGDDPAGGRCRHCHGTTLKSLVSHSPDGAPAWKSHGRLPLFDRAGERNDYGFITCPTCHEVHQGPEERAMRLEDRDPPQLCLSCHEQKQALLGSVHDPRSSGEEVTCNRCHPVHALGDSPPLWSLRSAARGSWNDRKCSPCHGSAGGAPLPHAGTGSHPTNVALPSGMKPQGLPLYDALGGRTGRLLACSTCHDLHGTARSGSTLPSFLRKDPGSGELCTACHPSYGSIEGTPHDLRTETASGLGPCGPCHAVHHAATTRSLWGLPPAPGEYLANRLCRSCHRSDGPVQSDYQLLQYHMKDAEPIRSERGAIYLQRPMSLMDEWALKTGEDPVIPLYDRDGKAGLEGSLQCASCHEPHQWSPMGAFVKPGFGALGPNVPTSFLRIKETRVMSRSVCAVCHAQDAVQRYREYHYVWEKMGDQFR